MAEMTIAGRASQTEDDPRQPRGGDAAARRGIREPSGDKQKAVEDPRHRDQGATSQGVSPQGPSTPRAAAANGLGEPAMTAGATPRASAAATSR